MALPSSSSQLTIPSTAPSLSSTIGNNPNLKGLGSSLSFAPSGTSNAGSLVTPGSIQGTSAYKPPPPTSPLTKTSLGSFGHANVQADNADSFGSNVATTPSGGLVHVDSTGKPLGASSFSIENAPALSPAAIAANAKASGGIPTQGQGSLDPGTTQGATQATSGTSALASGATSSGAVNANGSYLDYVNSLANASQYSPDYVNAYNQAKQAQQGQYGIQSTYYNDPRQLGETLGQSVGQEQRQLGLNSVQQGEANVALSTQELIRQGNIAAASALVSGTKPESVGPGSSLVSPGTGQVAYGGTGAYSDYQAQQTYFNLAQNFPDAQIPAYDPTKSAQENLQTAQSAAAQAPSFQSRNLVQVQLPGGGVSFVNRNQIVTNPLTGQASIVSPAQATAATAASSAVKDLTTQQTQLQTQLGTIDNNFPILQGIVQKYGLNTSNALINQLQNKVGGSLGATAQTQLNAVVAGLKATISQVVARGGTVDDKTRSEADAILPSNVTYQTLSDLYNTIQKEGSGYQKSITDQISKYNSQLNGIYASGSSMQGNGSGSSNTSGGPVDISQMGF